MSSAWIAVLKLGRIEWMRPTYHTKKHIYPVGYSAVRAVELSATRGHMVQCLCEIGESADSLDPVFRYTTILCTALRRGSDLLNVYDLVPSDHMNFRRCQWLSRAGVCCDALLLCTGSRLKVDHLRRQAIPQRPGALCWSVTGSPSEQLGSPGCACSAWIPPPWQSSFKACLTPLAAPVLKPGPARSLTLSHW